ncbi:MAG: ATPase [Anaerolineaceae bacterium]|nr:ATPase [Anaerolineaceae bacterium]
MKQYFLGVDVGGTKSHAVISDETGTVLGFGAGGTGNHEMIGYDGFASVIESVTNHALATAGLEKRDLTAIGMGIAGLDWPRDEPLHRDVIRQIGLCAPMELVNDAVIGLIAGSRTGWGVSLVAGTGSNCRGRDANGREGRVSGVGNWSGEYGGAGDLVRVAMHSVTKAWSCRGPETSLGRKFVEYVGAKDVTDLLEGLSRDRYQLQGQAVMVVFEAAHEQDAVAVEAIRWLGHELGDLAIGVIRQLQFENLDFDLVLTGSVYKGSPLVAKVVAETVHKVASGAALVRLTAPPVVGAVMLAMEQVKLDHIPLREKLIQSTNHVLVGDAQEADIGQ